MSARISTTGPDDGSAAGAELAERQSGPEDEEEERAERGAEDDDPSIASWLRRAASRSPLL